MEQIKKYYWKELQYWWITSPPQLAYCAAVTSILLSPSSVSPLLDFLISVIIQYCCLPKKSWIILAPTVTMTYNHWVSPLLRSHQVHRSVAMSNYTSGIERTARRLTSFEVWICRQWSGVYRCEFESLGLLYHISLNGRCVKFVSSVWLSCELDFILFCCVSIRLPKIFWLHWFTSRQILRKEKGKGLDVMVENIQEEILRGTSHTCLYYFERWKLF